MGGGKAKGMPALATELWELVLAYLKQETVGPIKGLGRFLLFGLAGAVALSIGLVLLALAGLRALQTELGTTFDGNLSWIPYVLTLLGCAMAAGLAGRSIGAKKRRAAEKGSTT